MCIQEDSQLKGSYLQIVKVDKPRQIAFATTGEMVVCEFESNCVTVFDPSSNYRRLHSFGSHGTEETIRKPSGIAISSDNTVFVAASDSVKKFTLDGNFIASVGSCGSGRLQFDNPSSIAYNATNNRVYVCDTRNNRITVLNYDLTFHDSFGSASHDFNMPNGIAVDKTGNVLVGDCKNNGRIQVLDANGHHLSSITHCQLFQPNSVSVGPNGSIYVVGCGKVLIFAENGRYIKSLYDEWETLHIPRNPTDITVANDGSLYVSNYKFNQVQIFTK